MTSINLRGIAAAIVAAAIVMALPARAQTGSWVEMPDVATDIAVGANGSAFIIGKDKALGGYGVRRWSETQRAWEPFPGAGLRIAVDPKGSPWLVNESHEIWRWDGMKWVRMPRCDRHRHRRQRQGLRGGNRQPDL
jgi:hypothetical protein